MEHGGRFHEGEHMDTTESSAAARRGYSASGEWSVEHSETQCGGDDSDCQGLVVKSGSRAGTMQNAAPNEQRADEGKFGLESAFGIHRWEAPLHSVRAP